MRVNGLNYVVTESGSGPPLVMLHGFTGSSATWVELRPLLEDDFRVIAIDLPGHGLTDSPISADRYTMESVAADLVSILRSLEAAPAHVYGYSMGGRLALYMALNHPTDVRSLTMESASPGNSDTFTRTQRHEADVKLASWIESHTMAEFVDRWENLPLFKSQARLSETRRLRQQQGRLGNNKLGLANSLRGMGTGSQPPLWKQLIKLTIPVLIFTGDLDTKFSSIGLQMNSFLPDSTLKSVPHAGHNIHLEQPEAVAVDLLSFLRSTGKYQANAEQYDENERSQRHLLKPGVERG